MNFLKGDGSPLAHTATSGKGFEPTGQSDGFMKRLPNWLSKNDPYRTSGYDDYPGPPSPGPGDLEPFEVPPDMFDPPKPKAGAKKPAKGSKGKKPTQAPVPSEHLGGWARVVCRCGADAARQPIDGPDVIVMTVDTCATCNPPTPPARVGR